MRILAAFEEERNPLFPDVLTLPELGYDITLGNYYFILAPHGVPSQIIRTLNDAFARAISTEYFQQCAQNGGSILAYEDQEALKARLEKDYAFLGKMIEQLNLKG